MFAVKSVYIECEIFIIFASIAAVVTTWAPWEGSWRRSVGTRCRRRRFVHCKNTPPLARESFYRARVFFSSFAETSRQQYRDRTTDPPTIYRFA